LVDWAESDATPRKLMAHTAMSDIRETIQELRYYRQAIFKG
jgi:oligoribonuclease